MSSINIDALELNTYNFLKDIRNMVGDQGTINLSRSRGVIEWKVGWILDIHFPSRPIINLSFRYTTENAFFANYILDGIVNVVMKRIQSVYRRMDVAPCYEELEVSINIINAMICLRTSKYSPTLNIDLFDYWGHNEMMNIRHGYVKYTQLINNTNYYEDLLQGSPSLSFEEGFMDKLSVFVKNLYTKFDFVNKITGSDAVISDFVMIPSSGKIVDNVLPFSIHVEPLYEIEKDKEFPFEVILKENLNR